MLVKDVMSKYLIIDKDWKKDYIFEPCEDVTLFDDALTAYQHAEELEAVITFREYCEYIRECIHEDA